MTRGLPDHLAAERHLGGRAAWLRAAVLGANDGLISTASLMIGVAAAVTTRSTILVAGIAGLTAGALSMAAGEYVSVSSQRDTEHADLARERSELGINPDELANPVQASVVSALSFFAGAILPIVVIAVGPAAARVLVTMIVTLIGLVALGSLGARLGGAPQGRAAVRVFVGGFLALLIPSGSGGSPAASCRTPAVTTSSNNDRPAGLQPVLHHVGWREIDACRRACL